MNGNRIPAKTVVTASIAALLANAALAADAKNIFENPGFETWDESSGLPAATKWRWRMAEPFAVIERSAAERRTGESSLHLKDDDTGRRNQTLGHVIPSGETGKIAGRRLEFSIWAKQVSASSHRAVGISIWGRREGGETFAAYDSVGTTLATDWRRLRTALRVPEDADLVIAFIHCASGFGATAEAFFDDASLVVLPDGGEKDGQAANDDAKDRTASGFRETYERQPAFASDQWKRPTISCGTFYEDGRPVFFLGPWMYNHPHTDWPEGNPDRQKIGHRAYSEAPARGIFEFMGFNASQLSAAWALPGLAMYGLDLPEDWARDEERMGKFLFGFRGQPMVVDFAFGFDGALKSQKPDVAREIDQQNPKWHKFIPFCPEHPDGDRYYRCYLRGGAASALRSGANVFIWELFNESSYMCRCRYNAKAFADEMERRFRAIGAANRAWGTSFADFGEVAAQTDFGQYRRLWPDYMKFMARRYAGLLRDCSEEVRSVDARENVYFTEQSSAGTIAKERNAGMDYRLVADSLDTLAYEGGLRFGYGDGGSAKGEMEDVVFGESAGHFFDMDFYQALARGSKPMLNHELYCMRTEGGLRVPSRREDIVTTHWAELFHGSSGAFTYCWDKRSWEWKTVEDARKVVEKPSYKSASLLNPWNYPPDRLDGFRIFRDELEPLRDMVLPFPRTRPPSVAVFFSYPTVRMLPLERMDYRGRLVRWYGAVLGNHYPVRIVFEEDLVAGLPERVKALVVPSARYATPGSVAAVSRFAARGGTVIADGDAFLKDERGDPLPKIDGSVLRLDADDPASVETLAVALAKSGARRDAVLTRVSDGLPPSVSDVQVIDRGDFKLLYFVAMGEREKIDGKLCWNISEKGDFHLSDPVSGRIVKNGESETWNAESLAKGIPVAVPPQERVLLRLSRDAP